MSRVRRGFKARQRRNKIFKLAKGFHRTRRTKFKFAAETVRRALQYAYIGRRLRKRDMRRLWITRIGAGARLFELSYSRLMGALKKKNVELNRKMLAELASTDLDAFKAVVETAK